MSYRFVSSVLCLCPLVAAFACGGDRFDEECPPGTTEVGTACVKDNPGAGAAGSAGAAGGKAGGAGVGGGAAGLGGAGGAGTSGAGGAGAGGSAGTAGKGGSAGGSAGAAGAGAGGASGKGGAAGAAGSSAGSSGTAGVAGAAGMAGAGGTGGAAGAAGAGGSTAGAAGQGGAAAGTGGASGAGAGGDGGSAGGAGAAGDAGASGAGGDPGCQNGKTKCEGATLQTCDADAWKDVKTCALGCAADACIGVTALAVGGKHACAALSNGTVRCWGYSTEGALGAPGVTSSTTPLEVQGLSGVTSLALGSQHSCARTSLGEVWCWGSNSVTQLGVQTPGLSESASPVKVPVASAASLSAIGDRTCALLAGGQISCWGAFPSPTPTAVSGPTSAVQISVGGTHLCARDTAGVGWCWGDNKYGQSGASPVGGSIDSPHQVMTDIVDVQAGFTFSCARKADPDGRVLCWGDDSSETLGNGEGDGTSPGPVAPVGTGAVELLSVGDVTTLAVEKAGSTKCWGYMAENSCASLAPQSNQFDVVFTPSVVPDFAGKPLLVAAGRGTPAFLSCALVSPDEVLCWGSSLPASHVATVTW